jgi:hypothetical protein
VSAARDLGLASKAIRPRRWPLGTAIQVRAVLAGAYVGRGRGGAKPGPCLTHAVRVDAEGCEVGEKTLCGRILVERLCDVWERGAPSCPECARRVGR